jgi:hydrogenase 3 maturation protease
VAGKTRQVVVLGVGNRLRGDDAIGCVLCDELLKTGSAPVADVFVVDCGSTPENYVQPVAEVNPIHILVADCCNYGGKPGEFRLFSRQDVDRLTYGLLSTHTLPLTLTIEMLSLETRATIELLGIQPEQIEFGEDLSEPIRRALPSLIEFVRNWVRRSGPGA